MSEVKDSGEGATPLRVEFIAMCGTDIYTQNENIARNVLVPYVDYALTRPSKLAVVGGGISAKDNIAELSEWDGDIWGINNTACWLNSLGIKAALFTVDVDHKIGETLSSECLENINEAILSSAIDSSIFNSLGGKAAKFDMSETGIPGGIPGGTNSVGRTNLLALLMGYTEIHYFGFEGSIDSGHVVNGTYNAREDQLLVKTGEDTHRTTPELYLQCQEMSKLMTEYPHYFINRSGGLLKGMIDNHDSWEVVGISEKVKQNIEDNIGTESIFKEYYEVAI